MLLYILVILELMRDYDFVQNAFGFSCGAHLDPDSRALTNYYTELELGVYLLFVGDIYEFVTDLH